MANNAIDISKLPVPKIVTDVDFEAAWATFKADLISQDPLFEDILKAEGQALTMLGQAYAYRSALDSQQFNERARGLLLALATGSDLDHIGALPFFNVTRLVIQAADDTANPPIPLIMESDADFRSRIQLSLDGSSAAGPAAAYEFNARSADAQVRDAKASSPTPGHVVVHVLAREGDGTPSAAVLQAVDDRLQDDDVRQLCSTVEVQPAQILTYSLEARLTLLPGPDQAVVVAAAQAAIEARVAELHAMGRDITLSALTGPLDQPGVQEVVLVSPAARIEVDDHQAAYCTGITLTVVGRDV